MKLDSLSTEAGAASDPSFGLQNLFPKQTSTDATLTAGTPFDFAYNVPDGSEENQEVIRSELMFFNTPLTEKYSTEVYGAVQNIQDQCYVDFQNICPESAPYMNLNSLMAQLIVPMEDQRIYRGRRLNSELKTGADYVGYLRSFYAPFNLHLLEDSHFLSSAVYRDPNTGKFKAVDPRGDRNAAYEAAIKPTNPQPQVMQVRSHAHTVPKAEHHHHTHRRLGDELKKGGGRGRKAAPGWHQPKPATANATPDAEQLDPEPQTQTPAQAQGQMNPNHHAHTVPKVEHHQHTHRDLRDGAPGWHQPPSVKSADVSTREHDEGRPGKPGWHQPSSTTPEFSTKAIKPTDPQPQVKKGKRYLRDGAPGWHQPSSAVSVHKHDEGRPGAPGWHQPPSAVSDHEHDEGRPGAPGWHQPPSAAAALSDHEHDEGRPGTPGWHQPPSAVSIHEHDEGRPGAPGWHQPPSAAAALSVHEHDEGRPGAPGWHQPPSAVSVHEHDEGRPGKPGWHQPVAAEGRMAAPGWIRPALSADAHTGGPGADEFKSLVMSDEEGIPFTQLESGPCGKASSSPSSMSASASASAFRPTSLFFSPGGLFAARPQTQGLEKEQEGGGGNGGPGDFFRSFLMDFFSGRDVTLSLATAERPFIISVSTLGPDRGDDDGLYADDKAVQDDYYYVYADDAADDAYYADDGDYYMYDDALLLDDDDDEVSADDDVNAADDDDFFSQRFVLPGPGEEPLPRGQATIIKSAAKSALEPVAGAFKQLANPSTAHSRLSLMALRREGMEKERDVLFSDSDNEEEEEEDGSNSDGSEGKEDKHGRGHDHHDHHKGLRGIKARITSFVRGHSTKQAKAKKQQQLDHHHHHRDDDRPAGDQDEHHHHPPPPPPPRDDPRGPGEREPHGPPPPLPPAHPPLPVPEDHSFSGNLGFGADGDMCMYRGMSQGRVSQPCVAAVSDLYELRAQYWEESQQPQDFHHHHGLGLLILGVVLLVCLVRRIYAVRYEKKVRSLLTALHTHPHLKGSIEAETGLEVPAPVPAGTCCIGASTDGNSTGNTLVKAGKVIFFALLIFAVSFAVSFSSLEITMHLVNNWDKHAPEDPNTGEPAFTSPLAAMFVLFFVCTAQLTLLALLVRGIKACCFSRSTDTSAYGNGSASTSASSPSAPFDPRGPASRTSRLSQHAQHLLASLPPALFGRSRPQQVTDGYSPLLGEESMHGHSVHAAPVASAVGTEMTSVRMGAYPAQHASPRQQQQQQGQQQYVPVYVPMGPVTASPVGAHSINMV